MVATRGATRVVSPATNADHEAAAEPISLTRRTRHRTMMEGNQSQSELTGDSQPDEQMDDSSGPSLPANLPKRETRRSTRFLADKKQPDSTHEADVSESESCCSVVSDVQATPRTRRRTVSREKPKDDVSEADSCSSAISASRSRRAPRTLRKRVQTPATFDASKTDDDVSEAESCSTVVSLTKVLDTRRITRSRRKTALAITEADPSEPESCSSSVSGIPCSTVRRSMRIQRGKLIKPVPLNLEETTDSPSSPVSRRLRARRHETKSRPAEDVCDSDECKSGPSTTPWRSSRRKVKGKPLICTSDSESVTTDVCTSQDSPSSLRRRGTPCSSRTSSSSSNRAASVTRTRSKSRVCSRKIKKSRKTSDLSTTLKSVAALPEDEKEEKHGPVHFQSESVVASDAEETVELLDNTMTMEMVEAQECTMIENTAADFTPILQPDEKVLEPQSRKEIKPLLSENAELLENCVTKTQTPQEDVVDEMVVTVMEGTEGPENDVAMENNEKNVADVEEMAECEKAVEVSKGADETVTCVSETSLLLNDAEGPSTSSHIWADLGTTGQPSERSSQKEMTSLLDSSEDEESSDEGLSADEEDEGSSQEAVDRFSEEEMMCADEGQSSSGAHSDGLFVIDTRPGLQPDEKYYVDAKQTEQEDEEDFIDVEEDDEDEDSKVLFAPIKPMMQLSSSIDTGLKMKELGGLYISFDGSKPKFVSSSLKTQKNQNNQDELLRNSVIVPDLEKKEALPQESKREAKLKRTTEREKTTGNGWFNMKAPEVTEELRNDLKVLQMRSAMDPKRFYKRNDRDGFPKYFQVGTVVDSPVDFYHSRIPKKQRRRTIVEELLADAEFRSYNKRKYQEIVTEKAAHAAGRMNKKHKFHKKKMNK